MDLAVYLLEIFGIVACAISGTIIAMERKFDIFGIICMAVVTALGGGCLRDIILGINPPVMFTDYYFVISAAGASIVLIILIKILRKDFDKHRIAIEQVFNIFDAIGLGLFSAVGVVITIRHGFINNGFLCVFIGLMTACGGGVLRDMMSKAKPMIFTKHIYALASLLGALVCYIMIYFGVNEIISGAVCTIIVITLRMLATFFKWNLPRLVISDPYKSDDD